MEDLFDIKLINEQYKLLDAWKLFVDKGIHKSDEILSFEHKIWQQNKLLCVNPYSEKITIRKNANYTSELDLGVNIKNWAKLNSCQILLVDEKFSIISKIGIDFNEFDIGVGGHLDRKITGILAINISENTGKPATMVGIQHYVKAFHYHVSIAFPLKIKGEKHYLLCFLEMNSWSSKLDENLRNVVEQFVLQINYNDDESIELNEETPYNPISLLDINSNGKIISILEDNLLNLRAFESYKEVYLNSIFHKINIMNLFSGISQTVRLKKDDKLYIITPVSKISSFNLKCLVQKASLVSNLIFDKYYINKLSNKIPVNRHLISKNLYRKVDALLESKLPVIFVSDCNINTLIVSNFLLDYTKSDLVYNIDMNEEKKNLMNLLNALLDGWEGKDFRLIVSVFCSNNYDSVIKLLQMIVEYKDTIKFIVYMNHKNYSEIQSTQTAYLDYFKMSTIEINESFIEEIKNTYDTLLEENTNEINGEFLSSSADSKKIADIEKDAIQEVLIRNNYRISEACKTLGISRATLYRKLKKYSIKLTK